MPGSEQEVQVILFGNNLLKIFRDKLKLLFNSLELSVGFLTDEYVQPISVYFNIFYLIYIALRLFKMLTLHGEGAKGLCQYCPYHMWPKSDINPICILPLI